MDEIIVDGYVNESKISVEEFKLSDKIVKNKGNGNCLFHALSFLVQRAHPARYAGKINSKDIRQAICNYYKKIFGNTKSEATEALKLLSKGSLIEQQLYKSYEVAFLDDETTGILTIGDDDFEHQQQVCKLTVWGENTDVIVACMLYNINIVIFTLFPGYQGHPEPFYMIFTYKSNESNPTCHLHLKAKHYEAIESIKTPLLPIIKASKSKTEKSREKSREKSNSKTEKINPNLEQIIVKSNSKTEKVNPKSSSEKRTTRKGKYESVLDKLNTFYEKIEKFIPTGNKEAIENDFSDIQLQVVTMISALEALGSRSREKFSESPQQKQKKMDELASLKAMESMVSKRDKSKIQQQIKDLEAQL